MSVDINKEVESINKMYTQLSVRADKLYNFVTLYNEYINSQHDYGNQNVFSMLEIHILTCIDDNPGITATELASMWRRTKGAISQIATKFTNLGYVRREKENGNLKTVHLYVTEKGAHISNMHKAYDVADIVQTLQHLQRTCTTQEIEAFYKVLDAYTALLHV